MMRFDRFESENNRRQNGRDITFDFLGFTHSCGKSRRGKFIVRCKTSRKKFRIRCKEMNAWLKSVRNVAKVKEWRPVLAVKLRGHYQYYGVSGNMMWLKRYYVILIRLVLKWLNRRSRWKSFNWLGFIDYLNRYSLSTSRIVHIMYKLLPVRKVSTKSRMRENLTSGSVRGMEVSLT
jgi:RNA-directed DNA polymerase